MLDFPLEEIVVAETGPALSTHGGPHVVGVAVCQRAG
jgi:fatty acid-binding protein DegV